jgi:hypothetical protein
MLYNAFMSYSHAADGKLAPALQSALHRFAKPWYQLRALRVFRDKTSLSANPALWPSIEQALSESEFFLLLASPAAAHSQWVQQESDWWLKNRSSEKMLILLTDGDLSWDKSTNDFDWQCTTALPANLSGVFKYEPLYVDFRWVKTEDNLSLRHSQFRAAMLDIAAALHGRAKDELDGEDVRQHRRTRRVAWSAGAALMCLTLSSIVAAYLAIQQSQIAFSRELAASATSQLSVDPERSVLLAIEAAKASPTVQAERVLRHSLLASNVRAELRGHTDRIWHAAFSPDGKWVVTASQDQTARVWEALTGKGSVELRGHTDRVMSAAFSRDGKLVVTMSDDGTARVWEVATGRSVAELRGHSDVLTTIALNLDGTQVVTASQDQTARVWEVATSKILADLRGHSDAVMSAAFSPDGKWVVTASLDGTARIWATATGKSVGDLRGHPGLLNTIAFSADGKFVVTAGDRAIPTGSGR